MSSYGLRRRSLFGSANDYRSHRAGLPRARLFPEPAFVRPGIRFGQFVEFNIDTGNVVRVGGGRQKRIFWRRRWTARRRRTFLTTQRGPRDAYGTLSAHQLQSMALGRSPGDALDQAIDGLRGVDCFRFKRARKLLRSVAKNDHDQTRVRIPLGPPPNLHELTPR